MAAGAWLSADVPNGGSGVKDEGHSKPYPNRVANGERIAWDRLFRAYVKALEDKKPVIITGDLNVAHEEIGKTRDTPHSNFQNHQTFPQVQL
jgi:exonuclease III